MTKNEIDLDFIGMCIAHANKKEKIIKKRVFENKILELLVTQFKIEETQTVIHITLFTKIKAPDQKHIKETLILNSYLLSLGLIQKNNYNILTGDKTTQMFYLSDLTEEDVFNIFGDFIQMLST